MTDEQQKAVDEYRAAALALRLATSAATLVGVETSRLVEEGEKVLTQSLTGASPSLVHCPDCGTHLVYVPEFAADELQGSPS